MELQTIKQRFGIIGTSPLLDRAINIASQVAPTDLSVLITGESGVGKEVFPKIIHQLSSRKHGHYIAVNCGAIPEGTIDSELFGHEKGAFTGASDSRKGYFEVADGGTIFLDEVAELPVSTQVRLLRVLETGEFMKVGSSKVHKTNVRVIAATNVDIPKAISNGKFRQDLFYRLNSVPIAVPSLRERKDDIYLLFRKFSSDFSEKYRMPIVRLNEDAQELLKKYRWEGNIRQLKNVTEQISTIETDRLVDAMTITKYLPQSYSKELPVLYSKKEDEKLSERDLLYKVLFDMKKDISELKKTMVEIIQGGNSISKEESNQLLKKIDQDYNIILSPQRDESNSKDSRSYQEDLHEQVFETLDQKAEVIEESLSIQKKEEDLIRRALSKHHGKRKNAAHDLGISERTLYRKIKEYDINS
ncbi:MULTISPECIES: sigma-54-dependent Fis family transcriptional regulator [unclassified Lentimicrobium]|uniref:sigma-54 interaction domain-containing protein n=1 Tax=unclassified Lentimicrobium TaxID=2677434 RepID=UPI001555FE10|nr:MULTISPECIES: sigma-54 dependent transcriptional regulator [unclassified Lentimicrobium]NPD45827.1 sigma-54-dependent Fis family transcriptional regulator [Lentimicrobium sp. S6]NPD85808.1 sigma-54-dependent Fis family transcriptional regulator [Lentimicrobium sp. L6]